MADISKIALPNGSEYDIKDASAAQTVNNISPDANQNVETMVSLTSAQYEAIPASVKNSDNKLYLVTDEQYTYPVDATPTANSGHLVTSGGVYTALNAQKYSLDNSIYRTYQQLSGTLELPKSLTEINEILVMFCGSMHIARATVAIPACFIKEFPTQAHQANVYVSGRSYIGLQYVDDTHLTLSGSFGSGDYIDRVYIFFA